MIQTLYGILAIMLVMFLSLNVVRGTTSTQQKMILNEVGTLLTGIGMDVLDHIERKPFDRATDESKTAGPPTYPMVTVAAQLTGENTGEWGTNACAGFLLCDDIDDFDGQTVTRDLDGLVYTVEIEVHYVDAATFADSGGTKTFAKEVTVTISNPYLTIGDDPLEVAISRVFTYERITS